MSQPTCIRILTGAALTVGSVHVGQIALADADIAEQWCKAGIAEPAKKGAAPELRMTREGARPIRAEDLVEPEAQKPDPEQPQPGAPAGGDDGDDAETDEAPDAATDTTETAPAKPTKAERRAAAKAAKAAAKKDASTT